jgi:Sulfate permease family
LVQSCPRRRAGVAYDERPTDAVGNSCQTLRTTDKRPQIVRTSQKKVPGLRVACLNPRRAPDAVPRICAAPLTGSRFPHLLGSVKQHGLQYLLAATVLTGLDTRTGGDMGQLESMMTAAIADELTNTSSIKNRGCVGQRVANIATGFIGGMARCAMIGQRVMNAKSVVRGWLSTLVAGLLPLILAVILCGRVARIPNGRTCRLDDRRRGRHRVHARLGKGVFGAYHHVAAQARICAEHHAEQVIRGVSSSVRVATAHAFEAPQRMVVAFDGSPGARKALARLAQHPLVAGLPVLVAMAAPDTTLARQQLGEVPAALQAAGATADIGRVAGKLQQVLPELVKRQAQALLVLGAFGALAAAPAAGRQHGHQPVAAARRAGAGPALKRTEPTVDCR